MTTVSSIRCDPITEFQLYKLVVLFVNAVVGHSPVDRCIDLFGQLWYQALSVRQGLVACRTIEGRTLKVFHEDGVGWNPTVVRWLLHGHELPAFQS